MMTEQEAFGKWRPWVRFSSPVGLPDQSCGAATANRTGTDELMSGCVGLECMMWRWARPKDALGNAIQSNHYGYCGLAGKL